MKDAIGVITASVGLNRCFNADGQSNPTYDPNNYYCSLTTRNVNGGIETQLQPTLNLAAYEVSGLDFQTDWRIRLDDVGMGDLGTVSLNLVVSRLLDYRIQNLEGGAVPRLRGHDWKRPDRLRRHRLPEVEGGRQPDLRIRPRHGDGELPLVRFHDPRLGRGARKPDAAGREGPPVRRPHRLVAGRSEDDAGGQAC
ncbi:hypothetical protein [Phenylobacterium sp. J426]|uniref:hypothetical protein n=1 Tax=Phenylobacterium sp. J426 TaxID=2898439 RepID=UPI0035B1D4C2